MIKKLVSGLGLGAILLSSLLYFMVPPASANADVDWLDRWAKRVKITINSTNINETLTDFPVLICLSTNSGENAEDVSFVFDHLESDANRKKIAVTTSNGTTQCYVEIEEWIHTNEQAWLWAKVPNVSSNEDTVLYLYFDKDESDNTNYVGDAGESAAETVWDTNFVMVQHLEEEGGTVYDSTTNNNDGTPYPTLDGGDVAITACEDTNGWAGTSLSSDTNDMKEGSASLVDTVQFPTNGVTYTNTYNPAGSWDFGNRSLNFWFKSSRSNANFNSARVYVYDTNSPANWRYHNLTFNTNTWTRFNVGISSGGTNSATPPASNAIDRIEWQLAAADTVEFTNKIDIVYANGGPVQDAQGKINGGAEFDGGTEPDDYIQLPLSSTPATEFTVEAWIRIEDYEGYPYYSGIFRHGGWGGKGLDFALREDGFLYAFTYDSGESPAYNTIRVAKNMVTFWKDQWHYVVFTWENDLGDLWIDSIKEVDGGTMDHYAVATYIPYIGWGSYGTTTSHFNGKQDEIRYSTIKRSDAWIKASYETQRDHLLDFGVEENRPIPGTVMTIK